MNQIPRVRWMVYVAVVAYGLRLIGVPEEWQAAIAAAGVVVAKLLAELAAQIDAEDPYVHTMSTGRSARPAGFWRRVL